MDVRVTSHALRVRVWLNLRNIVSIVCGQADLCYTNMVALTLKMKPGLGKGEWLLRQRFPQEGVFFGRQIFVTVSHNFVFIIAYASLTN